MVVEFRNGHCGSLANISILIPEQLFRRLHSSLDEFADVNVGDGPKSLRTYERIEVL